MKITDFSESTSIVRAFRRFIPKKMDKPNMFIILQGQEECQAAVVLDRIVSLLSVEFELELFDLSPEDFDPMDLSTLSITSRFRCIAIDSAKAERIRDRIKEVIWSAKVASEAKRSMHEIFMSDKTENVKKVRLSDYGLFIPYREIKCNKIRTHTFSHKPFFYRYRTALEKHNNLPQNLSEYLKLLFTDCPNHLFQQSNFRSSARTCQEYTVDVQLNHSKEHELINLARASLSFTQFKTRHENLQKFLLLNDPHTVASEVPLWLEPKELKDYEQVFLTKDILTGHIDILRYENDGQVGIWDYKPESLKEQNAKIQIFLYAIMLSIRTGVCLKNVICGYFDESDIFFFEPYQVERFNGQFYHA